MTVGVRVPFRQYAGDSTDASRTHGRWLDRRASLTPKCSADRRGEGGRVRACAGARVAVRWSSPPQMAGRGMYPLEVHKAAGRASSSSSSSSSESSSSSSALSSSGDSEDEDNPYIARPLPSWLLQDLAAVSTAENANTHGETHGESAAQARPCSGANHRIGDTADELTDTSNRSSHTEVSIEIASLEDDATDTSLWSLRSAASLEEFSETNSDATDAPASGDGLAEETVREAAIREMTEMRWSAVRQQVRTSAHIHTRASARAHSRALKHEQSHAR
jgi:hypothetical protein